MINDELLECAESVLNFLVKSEEEFNRLRHFGTPSNNDMTKILKSHNTDMCDFAIILNNKFIRKYFLTNS